MTLRSDAELARTREKLAALEALYERHQQDTEKDSRVREHSMRSLKKLINQLREEIARFEVQHTSY